MEKRREQVNRSVRKFQKSNPWHNIKKSHKRRAKLLNQIGVVPDDAWDILIDLFGEACMWPGCNKEIIPGAGKGCNPLTLEHIIPLELGTKDTKLHDISNFQIMCRSHNSSKGMKVMDFRPFKYEYEGG